MNRDFHSPQQESLDESEEMPGQFEKIDTQLRVQFKAGTCPSAEFDQKLLAQISESEQMAQAAARQRAEREYRAMVTRVRRDWVSYWQRNAINAIAALAVLIPLMVSNWPSLNDWLQLTLNFIVPKSGIVPVGAIIASSAIAALSLWLMRLADRRLA
ncbi:MAG: hypothetical protein H7Y02_07190 [Candidatus Obscuribacterales bacterium]|nr:hypothetical protein [Steroidobacteraceae bacterium]